MCGLSSSFQLRFYSCERTIKSHFRCVYDCIKRKTISTTHALKSLVTNFVVRADKPTLQDPVLSRNSHLHCTVFKSKQDKVAKVVTLKVFMESRIAEGEDRIICDDH